MAGEVISTSMFVPREVAGLLAVFICYHKRSCQPTYLWPNYRRMKGYLSSAAKKQVSSSHGQQRTEKYHPMPVKSNKLSPDYKYASTYL